jgi:predicted small lipoprotein YifL
LLTLLGVGLLAATLAGCGRRGALEPPPDPSAKAAAAPDSLSPVARPPKRTLIKPPQDPFILDPLL